MPGFSVYLGEPFNKSYIKSMVDFGYDSIFTSVQIPEEDEQLKYQKLTELLDYLDHYEIHFIIDINPALLTQTLFQILQRYTNAHFIVRIDHSTSVATVNSIINAGFKCCLNASTITTSLLTHLKQTVSDFSNIIYCHNYYPRPDTGLSESFVTQQNMLILRFNPEAQIFGFISGSQKRGPIFKGLPTIEASRNHHPIESVTTLIQAKTTDYLIGDPYLEETMAQQLYQAIQHRNFILHLKYYDNHTPTILQASHTVRIDNPEHVIRSQEARHYLNDTIQPMHTVERLPGHITLDNTLNGRYEGELQIIKEPLSEHPHVNVIARVITADLPLIYCMRAGDSFSFKNQAKEM